MSFPSQSKIILFKQWVGTSVNVLSALKRQVIQLMGYLLRFLLYIGVAKRNPRRAAMGFILPTTVLLLLVVSLAVGSISLRTFTRTQQTLGVRQQQVIYNAATPVLDRARAKIDHLMAGDQGHPRNSTGIPPEDDLVRMMLNEAGSPFRHNALDQAGDPIPDIYTLEGETRIDIGSLADTTLSDEDADNAWEFTADTDGDGNDDAYVVYSILMNTPNNQSELSDANSTAVAARAANLEVRHGPQSLVPSSDRCPTAQQAGIEDGWFTDKISTAFLRKNFQVDAVVIPGIVNDQGELERPDPNATIVTLEFNQDRTFDRGNKWGAWFRNDLELFPGEPFRWNGAMHTEGSLVVGKSDFDSYLISSEFSCFNVPGASEISVGDGGQVVVGRVDIKAREKGDPEDPKNYDAPVHLYKGYGIRPELNQSLTLETDSVNGETETTAETISGRLILDPVKLLTANESIFRADNTVPNATTSTPDDWKNNSNFEDRITLGNQEPMSDEVLETYRDGHWETKAANGGYRVVVGQRLELEEPLAIWPAGCGPSGPAGRCNEDRQRRTLADKLGAVQASVVYNNTSNDPIACIATTAHPGTAETLKRAATFRDLNTDIGDILELNSDPYIAIEDFFTGRGTNGWEFHSPAELDAAAQNVMDSVALKNLAHFAGDPDAGVPYPGFDEKFTIKSSDQDTFVHPYPELTKWGDFSRLRRVLDEAPGTIASKSTKDTASCMLGMLAHNISYLNDLSLTAIGEPSFDDVLREVETQLNGVDHTQVVEKVEELANLPARNLGRALITKVQVFYDRSGGTCPTLSPELTGLCPSASKYPALQYIFPTSNFLEDRTEAYISSASVNDGFEYEALEDDDIKRIALRPREMSGSGLDSWQLPHQDATTATVANGAPNSDDDVLIACTIGNIANSSVCSDPFVSIAFKDAALMDARQLMSVRVLDINMDLFKTELPSSDTAIIYAAREDALREDEIVRPSNPGVDAADCTTEDADVRKFACLMKTDEKSALTSTDPPLAANGVSIKPVDYFPDPDRRPYGFRLRNGKDLSRNTAANIDESISFVSDNPVYILGDFNLHKPAGNDNPTPADYLEEFLAPDTLAADYGNFYGREKFNSAYGNPLNDSWRPTEILSDGLTVLSNGFCDGSVFDLFDFSEDSNINRPVGGTTLREKYGCDGNATNTFTSYTNAPYLENVNTGTNWDYENPSDPNSPIVIAPEGHPSINGAAYPGTYTSITKDRRANGTMSENRMIEPTDLTTVNAVMYSNMVPSRLNISYGGLHNFPRLLEDWKRDDNVATLSITGAFFQIGFSKYATAPYDQEQWEPDDADAADGTSIHPYYQPAQRQWGYDVALQKNPPATIAKEFISNSPLVSEFYSEPPVDDPYISRLCRKVNGAACPQ